MIYKTGWAGVACSHLNQILSAYNFLGGYVLVGHSDNFGFDFGAGLSVGLSFSLVGIILGICPYGCPGVGLGLLGLGLGLGLWGSRR